MRKKSILKEVRHKRLGEPHAEQRQPHHQCFPWWKPP